MLNMSNTYFESHVYRGIVGSLAVWNLFSKVSAAVPHLSSFSFCLGVDKGGKLPWLSVLRVVFLCVSHVSGRPWNLVQWLSPVILRVLHSVTLKFLIQSHFIKFRGLVDNFTFKMTSWKKASAVVGLSGLTPRDAARGALTCPKF